MEKGNSNAVTKLINDALNPNFTLHSPFLFFSNNAGELRVNSLRRRKKQRAGRNRPKYKKLHPTHTHHQQEANSYRKIKEATTNALTNLDTI